MLASVAGSAWTAQVTGKVTAHASDEIKEADMVDLEESGTGRTVGAYSASKAFLAEYSRHNFRETSSMDLALAAPIVTSNLDLELNTVDAFQGREKDFIIISCVRASDDGGIGFLSDTRRMNVAITRGRYGMFIVGRGSTLRADKHWGAMIRHAQAMQRLVKVSSSSDCLLARLKEIEGTDVESRSSNNQISHVNSSENLKKRKFGSFSADGVAEGREEGEIEWENSEENNIKTGESINI